MFFRYSISFIFSSFYSEQALNSALDYAKSFILWAGGPNTPAHRSAAKTINIILRVPRLNPTIIHFFLYLSGSG